MGVTVDSDGLGGSYRSGDVEVRVSDDGDRIWLPTDVDQGAVDRAELADLIACLVAVRDAAGDHDENELWPGTVGITVSVPHVHTEAGMRLMGPTQRKPWAAQLERCAKHLHGPARAVLQDEKTDWAGTPQADAILWCEADVDIPAMRQHLDGEGYSVSMASHYYGAAIA